MIVDDVLPDSNNKISGNSVDLIIIEILSLWTIFDSVTDSVMVSDKNGMQAGQNGIFISSDITHGIEVTILGKEISI